jgi:hypothetical protein
MRATTAYFVAAILLLPACAPTTTPETSLVTNSAPVTASAATAGPASATEAKPGPAITSPQDLSAVRDRLKAAQKSFAECVLKAAQGLAFQPENPAHIALAATQSCVRTERAMQDAALPVHGTRTFEYMRAARLLVQETAVGLIVRTRAAAKRPPASKPAPARGGDAI